jgi:DNA-binding transcriptional ArsR family regulator
MKIESSERFVWPSLGLELRKGENNFPELDELPEPVRQRILRYIQTGVVRVLSDPAGSARDELPSGIQESTGAPEQESGVSAAPPEPVPATDPGASPADGVAPAANDAAPVAPVDGENEATIELLELCRAMAHPVRVRIVREFGSGREFGFRTLERMLEKPRSSISEHLAILEEVGLIRCSRTRRKWRYRVDASVLERWKKLIP